MNDTDTNELVPAAPAAPLATSHSRAQHYAAQSSSPNTQRAYRSDWNDFTAWCDEQHAARLPADPATVATYAAQLADDGRAVATIARRLSSISQAHKLAGYEATPVQTELVRRVMKGIRRDKGSRQQQAAAAVVPVLQALLGTLPATGRSSLRDRALLLVGFAGALRRSELVNLDVADIRFVPEGMALTIQHSKTDQEARGVVKGIPYGQNKATCPVRALRAWLAAASITEGPIFRPIDRHGNVKRLRLSTGAVSRIVKRCANAAGLDAGEFSGHSLRAGFATAAAQAGAPTWAIKKQTGHQSDRVLARYIRDGTLFTDNAAGKLGL